MSVTKEGKLLKARDKKYWFGVSEGKVLVIPNLMRGGKKKVRTKQMDRVGQVIVPATRALGCNLAVIPYNFTRLM